MFVPQRVPSQTAPSTSASACEADHAACEGARDVAPATTEAPLPSGRQLDGAAHRCPLCGCDLVYPEDWERNSEAGWNLLLRCPNCETRRRVVADREGVETLNREIYRSSRVLAREADLLTRRNFSEEAARIAEALARDLILPMDF